MRVSGGHIPRNGMPNGMSGHRLLSFQEHRPYCNEAQRTQVSLVKQVLDSESEYTLHSLEMILEQVLTLTKEQKAQFDSAHVRYVRGEGKGFSSAQMVRQLRKMAK